MVIASDSSVFRLQVFGTSGLWSVICKCLLAEGGDCSGAFEGSLPL